MHRIEDDINWPKHDPATLAEALDKFADEGWYLVCAWEFSQLGTTHTRYVFTKDPNE